jgi:ubiquinone/menaquinone biosynthesis C-methylase UbiE
MSTSIAPASGRSPSSNAPPSAPGGAPSSAPSTYNVRLNEATQEVVFTGILRPFTAEQMAPIRNYLEKAAWSAATSGKWTLDLNFKRLKHMNNVAFLELNRFVKWAAEALPELKIKLVISSVVPWALSKFQIFAELYEHVSVDTYDKALYPFQQVAEDNDFIEILRTQERIIWEHERERLPTHGLRQGMRIADIGCGFGDFALLLQKDFKPTYLVGVDHSKPSLRYAQQVASDFGIENTEYQYGDAASLLLPDNSFDFVSCRLALQVFHEPDRIMQELFRICRPGGRVYLTNETLSCVVGFPNQQSILAAYQAYIELGRMVGVDIDIGVRTREILVETGFEDIKIHLIDINNMNTDVNDFAKVIDYWIRIAGQMAAASKADPAVYETIKAGFTDHIRAIRSDRGYATWPIYAGSGRKPFR